MGHLWDVAREDGVPNEKTNYAILFSIVAGLKTKEESESEKSCKDGWRVYNARKNMDESMFTAKKDVQVAANAKLQDKDEHDNALQMMDDESEPTL